jgi:hypothetical protein
MMRFLFLVGARLRANGGILHSVTRKGKGAMRFCISFRLPMPGSPC